jgi:hypothetical protein
VLEEQEVQGVLQEMQESMVINLSDSSSSSVNMMEIQPQRQNNNMYVLYNELNIGMVQTTFGPVLPPEMLCAHALQLDLPALCSRIVPETMMRTPFEFLNKLSGMALSVVQLKREGSMKQGSFSWPSGGKVGLVEEVGEQTPIQSRSVATNCRATKKPVAPLVQSSERRFTRSCLKGDGYRPAPILVVQPKIKKKPRARNLLMPEEEGNQSQGQEESDPHDGESQAHVPVIPIAVLQRVGHALGIAADKLSEELHLARRRRRSLMMNKLWGMIYIGVLWWSLCLAFDVPRVPSLWSVVWVLVWGLVLVLVNAFVKTPVSEMVVYHGWYVWSGAFDKYLAVSVSKEVIFPGVFVCSVIGIMCQFICSLLFIAYE